MIKIKITVVGDIYPLDCDKLISTSRNSKIFHFIPDWQENRNPDFLSKHELALYDSDFQYLKNEKTDADFILVLVNRRLEGNYISRVISDKLIVVTIFEIESLNIHEGISLEQYILRLSYGFATIFIAYKGLKPEAIELMQNNATGCLFDKAIFKPEIAKFFRNPHLSVAVKAKLETKILPRDYVKTLETEIKKLKIGNYYNIRDYFKKNSLVATIAALFIGLMLDVLGNYLYDTAKIIKRLMFS